MAEIQKRYLPTRHGQLHLRLTGPAHGRSLSSTPLLLLHQTASSSAMFIPLMRELGAERYLIAPDTPGFGQSFNPSTRPSIPLYAQAIFEGMQALGIGRCFVFGHHTGAAIGLQLAHDHPDWVEKLALCGPPLLTPAQIDTLSQTLSMPQPDGNGRFLLHTWQWLRQKDPNLPLPLLKREFLLTLQAGENGPQAYTAVFRQPIARQLQALTCPTLVLAGETDSLATSLEPAYRLLSHGRMHRIADAGTFICDTHPQLVASLLRDFFFSD